jgi:type I restriction enzyme, S subunit
MKYTISSYKKLKDHDDWRWDGEFICFEPYYNKHYTYAKIGDILISSQYGISIDMNEECNGYKIYRMNEISNMFCNRDIDKCADVSREQANKFILNNNDVLFNRTNSQDFVGRTGIFKKFSDDEILFASYLIRIKPDEKKILPECLTVFLNTKYGIQDIKRRARISINQSNVNAEELKRITIPLFSIKFQNILRNIFNNSFDLTCKSDLAYSQAEQLLLSEISLLNWKPKHQRSFIKNYSDTVSASRIDAEYYQPMYDEIAVTLKQYKHGYDELEDMVKIIDTNYQPKENVEYKYIELTNIGNNGEIINYSIDKGINLPTRARRIVQNNDLIVSSIEGSLDKIAIIQEKYNLSLCSTGFFVLRSPKIEPEVLLLFLKSIWGSYQLKRGCKGTILTAISKNELQKIIIPCVDPSLQKTIKQMINKSFSIKDTSKILLEIAKRGVEMAIEQDENTAEKWINDELEKLEIDI